MKMAAVGMAFAMLAVAGCAASVSAADPPGPACSGTPRASTGTGKVRPLVTGLCVPWAVAFLPDGSALVTERETFRILSVTAQGVVREVQRLTEPRRRGEGGLLGIAVSPHYATDKWVYVYYTTQTDNRIARLRLGQPLQPIFTGIPAAGFHNGGRIAFGPDGMLYAATGDAGGPVRAQDATALNGKILRLTPDGAPAPGNPFGASPIWSLGHRNVQGLAWDKRGRMYASEFGASKTDELNRIEPGRNYGWPIAEGRAGLARFADPFATWSPTTEASPSGIAIAGGHVYVACLAGRRLYRVSLDDGTSQPMLRGAYGRLRDVVRAPDGSLWILTSNRDGRGTAGPADDQIIRLTP